MFMIIRVGVIYLDSVSCCGKCVYQEVIGYVLLFLSVKISSFCLL